MVRHALPLRALEPPRGSHLRRLGSSVKGVVLNVFVCWMYAWSELSGLVEGQPEKELAIALKQRAVLFRRLFWSCFNLLLVFISFGCAEAGANLASFVRPDHSRCSIFLTRSGFCTSARACAVLL